MSRLWTETYSGGSPEAERREFESFARDLMRVQLKTARTASRNGVPHGVDRAFHAKSTLAVDNAQIRFVDVADDLRVEFSRPGASYPTVVRFSNAAGTGQADAKPDLRGVALRIQVSPAESHDLLMTNFPVSHARNAHQFVEFAKATAGGNAARLAGILQLLATFGPGETTRMLRNVTVSRRRTVSSVATETYWSRGAVRWGPTLAVRYLLRPAPDAVPAPAPRADDPGYLSTEAARRLAADDVRFELCVQRYIDEESTPIEDTAVRWSEQASVPEPVAVLTIPRQDLSTADTQERARAIDALAFNPWNTTDTFRPLGNLNRARKAAYDASAAHRQGYRWAATPPLRNELLGAGIRELFAALNRVVAWHRLPPRLGLLNLQVIRQELRRRNLLDTEETEAPPRARPVPPAPPPEPARIYRAADGTDNDLSVPTMGAVGATFGRNLRPDYRPNLFDEPNPVTVSRELLIRDRFLPARSLNLLAAAWIQFQVHDWVSHARYPIGKSDITVPLPDGMTWANTPGGRPERQMRIAGNISRANGRSNPIAPVFGNVVSHWWDGSEIYGADPNRSSLLRDGAKLRMTPEGYLPRDLKGFEITGFNESWWLGLSAMHTLFAREHNLLCDELRRQYRGWTDERIYQTARLIVSALIAKIHTVEWTPAILGTETLNLAMNANWNGPNAHDWLTRLGIWLFDTHARVGIPKTMPDHHGVPYSLTEDFVAVYRMHPLVPDDYQFADHRTGKVLGNRGFLDIQGALADDELRAFGLENTLYSFALAYPGAITLHNYPRSLQRLERDGQLIDLSVIDLVRTRRRGVPRYNDFRAGLHKPRIRSWEELCGDPDSAQALRRVYRTIDEVDTMVGLFAETPPAGFGFSDTAFRIFILMASRRLQSDRFLTVDFRPEVYSPFGMDWVANNGMTSLILRHCPDLSAVLPREASAFVPWRPVPASTAGVTAEHVIRRREGTQA
ncbi:peroxidase family protein [Frankia sp. Cj5]|uniref:peroxidase family protein n=1 Tax=Frankia sp. Cj5 TaxID=2880978 RepID=UPI001EF485FD|nr:peroxidase family protein [Frankia sp. Cj5]